MAPRRKSPSTSSQARRTSSDETNGTSPPNPTSSKEDVQIAACSLRIEFKVNFGSTTFHDILLQVRKTMGDNKLYFEGNVEVLSKPSEDVEDFESRKEGMVVGYEDSIGSIVSIEDVNTIVVNLKHDDETGRRTINLHPLLSFPSTSSYIGNQMVYTNLSANNVLLSLKSMEPITTVRYVSSKDHKTVLELDTKTLGVSDLNDATVRHIMAYIEEKFNLETSWPTDVHLTVNGHVVPFEDDSWDSLLREWAPHGGTIMVQTRPDLKDLLNMHENHQIMIFLGLAKSKSNPEYKYSPIICSKEATVGQLKEIVQEQEGFHPHEYWLLLGGERLDDGKLFKHYEIEEYEILGVIMEQSGGMFHFTSGRQDFSDLSDVNDGRRVTLVRPDGSRKSMYIRPTDSLADLKRIALALLEDVHALNNAERKGKRGREVDSHDPSSELSLCRVHSSSTRKGNVGQPKRNLKWNRHE